MECQLTAKLARSEKEKTEAVRSGSHWYKVAHENAAKIAEKDAKIERFEAALLKIASGVPVVGLATTRGLSVLDMAGIASKALK